MSAPGTANVKVPSDPHDTRAPPMVGFPRNVIWASPALRRCIAATDDFTICRTPKGPSCMRIPPDAMYETTGMDARRARSNASTSFSPATTPMLPPMKRKSLTMRPISWPATLARPVRIASLDDSPRRRFVSRRVLLYDDPSPGSNLSGSAGGTSESQGSKLPVSTRSARTSDGERVGAPGCMAVRPRLRVLAGFGAGPSRKVPWNRQPLDQHHKVEQNDTDNRERHEDGEHQRRL